MTSYVPSSEEAIVLKLLSLQEKENKPTHGIAVANASNGQFSVAETFSILDHLTKQGAILRTTEKVKVGILPLKRSLYHSINNNDNNSLQHEDQT